MAIPIAVGALKASLKRAAIAAAQEYAKNGLTNSALEEIGRKALSDADAVILNRLKTSPNRILFELASNEMGLPVNDVKLLVKKFNQTPKMAEYAKGDKFKELAVSKLKNKLGLSKFDKIRDIIRKAEEENAKKKEKPKNKNAQVKSLLKRLQSGLKEKIEGSEGTQNQYRELVNYDLDIEKYFDSSKEYTETHEIMLEKQLVILTEEIENYEPLSGGNLILIKDGVVWKVDEEQAVNDYIDDFKDSIEKILGV